jgi:ribosomal-protein-alanine N-acetyltransferase
VEPIKTARLVIRPFTSIDIDDFQEYQSHPDVRRYLLGNPLTAAEATAFISAQAALADGERDGWHAWAVEHAVDGRVIGDVGAYLPARVRTEADLGFQFHPDYQGLGYAHEATAALVSYLFETMGITRITASRHQANQASARLLLNLGMSEVSGDDGHDRTFELTHRRN